MNIPTSAVAVIVLEGFSFLLLWFFPSLLEKDYSNAQVKSTYDANPQPYDLYWLTSLMCVLPV